MQALGPIETLTRAGFAARGIMYGVIGALALHSGRSEGGAGALAFLQGGLGRLLLAAMALGFLGYGLWRLAEAAIDTENNGTGFKGVAVRAGGAVSGVIHIGLCILAADLAAGSDGGSGDGAEKGAATALALPGGQALVLAAAAALAAVGLYQLIKAARGGFLRHLDPAACRRSWVIWLGRCGYAARGVVFLIMAWFFWRSASETNAAAAGGMGQALGSLPDPLQVAVAAGLLLFGMFSLVEARYRRINDPHVLARLKAAAA